MKRVKEEITKLTENCNILKVSTEFPDDKDMRKRQERAHEEREELIVCKESNRRPAGTMKKKIKALR